MGDGCAVLDLQPLGFRWLFDAEWIRREPSARVPSVPTGTTWRRVKSLGELERWETAWRDNGSPAESRVFLRGLLARDTLAPHRRRG